MPPKRNEVAQVVIDYVPIGGESFLKRRRLKERRITFFARDRVECLAQVFEMHFSEGNDGKAHRADVRLSGRLPDNRVAVKFL